MLVSYSVTRLPDAAIHDLTAEDGFYENTGASFFLLTGIIFTFGFIGNRQRQHFLLSKTRRNYIWLLLGVFFLFIFGEEISWGQRVFGITPGNFFNQENLQQETNLHNLRVFNSVDKENMKREWWDWLVMSRLFRLFWFVWCLVLPLTVTISSGARKSLLKSGIPSVPIGFGLLLLLNYFIFKILELTLNPLCEVVEIEESVTAFLMLTISIQTVLLKNQFVREPYLLHATNPIHSAGR